MEKAFTKINGDNSKGSLPNLQPMPPSQPFAVVEHLGAGAVKEKGHHFTPSARLVVTPALRTSGLLAALPDDALRPLLLLLTFLTPNGDIHPAVCEIAAALQVNERKTREMMRRLVDVAWKGEPVARELPQWNDGSPSSLDRFTLSRHLITHQVVDETDAQGVMGKDTEEALTNAAEARRTAVVEHSRAAYGVPRAEAERQVAYQLGHSPEEFEDTEEGQARRGLRSLGLTRDQIEQLVANHPIEEIRRQLDWLPHRAAKSPVRFLIAAIEGRYAPPIAARLSAESASGKAAEENDLSRAS